MSILPPPLPTLLYALQVAHEPHPPQAGLPVAWLLGLLPPLESALLWLGEQVGKHVLLFQKQVP